MSFCNNCSLQVLFTINERRNWPGPIYLFERFLYLVTFLKAVLPGRSKLNFTQQDRKLNFTTILTRNRWGLYRPEIYGRVLFILPLFSFIIGQNPTPVLYPVICRADMRIVGLLGNTYPHVNRNP